MYLRRPLPDPSRKIMSYTLRVQFDETNGEGTTAVRQVAREISARVRRFVDPGVRYGSLGN